MARGPKRTWAIGELLRWPGELWTVLRADAQTVALAGQDDWETTVVTTQWDRQLDFQFLGDPAQPIPLHGPVPSIDRQRMERLAEVRQLVAASLRQLREMQRLDARSSRVLDIWAAVLPTRIADEDLGDFLEDINRRIRQGQRGAVYVRIAAAIFWTGMNSIGYAMKQLGRAKSGA